jgi:hypothetical protein
MDTRVSEMMGHQHIHDEGHQAVLVEKSGNLRQTSLTSLTGHSSSDVRISCGRFTRRSGKDSFNTSAAFVFNDDLLTSVYKAIGLKLTAKGNRVKHFGLLHLFDKDSFPESDRDSSGFTKTRNKTDFVCLFGLSDGKAGNENKFEFPPPIDTTIYYGTLCLIRVVGEEDGTISIRNLSVEDWQNIYSKLFGGFFDCDGSGSSDEEESDDDEDDQDRTKDGYAKDGFVVSDDDEEDDDIAWSEEEEYEFSDEE